MKAGNSWGTAGALVLVLVLAAGCLAPGPVGERPSDWRTGAELSAFRSSKSHSADETYWLHPLDAWTGPAPERCEAYQDGRRYAADQCTVGPSVKEGSGREHGPWTVTASWRGEGERLHEDVELHPERRTVAAFDGDGRPVAWWDRRIDPDASRMTE